MRNVERFLLLQIIDQRWQEHLYDMDYLQQGIHLRGFAQIEPLVAYKNEAFELFRDLMNSIWGDFARLIYHVEVTVQDENGNAAPPPPPQRTSTARSSATGGGRVSYSGGSSRSPARWRWPRRTRARSEYAARGRGAAGAAGRAAPGRRGRADRPQRPVLVRLGQEVQEVPRRLRRRGSFRRGGFRSALLEVADRVRRRSGT